VRGFIAGNVTSFPPGSINHFEQQHFFLVNLPDGGFVALHDLSSRQQELKGDCRVHYEENAVLVHTDDSLLPRRANARACWNAFLPASPDAKACVTYDMNLLQGLQASRPICVSLNATDEISSAAILRRLHYRHPVLSADAINAQGLLESLNGRDRVYYCGAYFGYGFHEDGVTSAMAVARRVHAR
jgi:predicted NAD/FAD-binding protein